MWVNFEKYQGTGNDFIIIDNRKDLFPSHEKEKIIWLCDRKFGIGADGLILIENDENLDFKMVFYNPDGSQSFCGNGSRCAVAFAKKLDLCYSRTKFLATDGVHSAEIRGNQVRLKMRDVTQMEQNDDFLIDTGSPHYIKFVDDVGKINVVEEGKKIRYSETFSAAGVNVNFVHTNEEGINIRTYERGVENETLSCGTGVTASVLAYALSNNLKNGRVKVCSMGGMLEVDFEKTEVGFHSIYLTGPANFVFKGTIEI